MRSRIVVVALGLGGALSLAALLACCSRSRPRTKPASEVVEVDDPIAHLRAFESARRSEAHFFETKPQDRAFGADPYDVVALGSSHYAGILRGRDRLAVFDHAGKEIAHLDTPRAPSGIAVASASAAAKGDLLYVVSEIEPVIARYRFVKQKLERVLPDIALGADVYGVRDVATGPAGAVYAIEEHDGRLFTSIGNRVVATTKVQRGPLRIARTKHEVVVASLFDHDIALYKVDAAGAPIEGGVVGRAKIDGPFWGLSAIDLDDDNVLIVAGGAEDHALDRRGGFFGYVDSFVYGYRFNRPAGKVERVFTINAGEHGLILPKATALSRTGAFVTSYGGSKALRLKWSGGVAADGMINPAISVINAPPGSSAVAAADDGSEHFVLANPLLDAWVFFDAEHDGYRTVRALDGDGEDKRTDRERLGEALFFTELMAPASSSDGAKSRFTCETCHFEGYVDGRIHHTGRGEIHAVTKPLVGLFNNRPHFSRALDPDLSAVAENEFRVAGAPSPTDPHFDIDAKAIPWLAHLGIEQRRYDAAELRLSLMAFLMSFSHRTNPHAARLASFGDLEKKGATLFRDRCEGCHQARSAADDASSRVPFDQWEASILNGGPLVWASESYQKTGIEPYVHERGARVPSLRRLYKKHPYFTNGSADTVVDVLMRARFREPFSHDGGNGDGDGPKLDDESVKAIAAFLDLL